MAKQTIAPPPKNAQASKDSTTGDASPVIEQAPLEALPITHHAVSCALAKAEAALALLRLAEEHYDGEDFEWMSMICTDVIAEELATAKAAYAQAVDTKTATEAL